MARKKKSRKQHEEERREGDEEIFGLHPDTKKSIWAIAFFGIALILILSRFAYAGPVGDFLYSSLYYLFGIGYYLLPLILFVLSGLLLASEHRRIYKMTFIGAIVFILSNLGLIEIISAGGGGLVGRGVSALQLPFGYTAAIVLLVVIDIISLLATFNLPIRLTFFKKGEGGEDEGTEEIEETVEESITAQEVEEEEEEPVKESEPRVAESQPSKKVFTKQKVNFKNYVAPPLGLLKSSVEKPTAGDLRANANIIKRTFDSFGIPVEMGEINIGPKFTRYTLKPAEGIKLSRITALNQDLALALASHPIRIEAPIPGKSLVGIEVPNKSAALVRLGSLLAYPEFNASGHLGFILGRDVSGEPMIADVDKMPHLLIAGSSGSGKSIAIHSLIASLLYKNSPETLRLILIDPKRVELSIYEGIPHLISPVITNPKKSLAVFGWLIEEMNRRYEILMRSGSRDIGSYNKKRTEDTMPYILIIIDELADLMVTYGREVEGSIVRLAQMARATGLHLVLSTQRPSVEVVTGLIKANITSRIALQLPSQTDSRTVLDTSGAEKLLGGGDMLFVSAEIPRPKRIQGAYISEEEVNKIADFIRDNNKNLVAAESAEFNGNEENGGDYLKLSDEQLENYGGEENDDELLGEAIQVVVEAQKASASLLQRRLKVGYARAARLLDIMESKGIVGPGEGAKPREVFKTRGEPEA